MVKVMDGLNSMPWISLGRLTNGWIAEGTRIPARDKFKYGYDLWSNGLAFEAFGIGRTYKLSLRAPGHGDGLWLFNFDSGGRVVNASFTGSRWGGFELPVPEPPMDFRLLPYPRYRPEMHRLIGGTWLRAKWTDQFDHSGLTYRAEILEDDDSFYRAAMDTLDTFVGQYRNGGVAPDTSEAAALLRIYRTLPLRTHRELKAEAARFHDILQIHGDIPVEAPELAFDHYHAIPVKVQDGCGGPCTFCSLYDRRIRVTPLDAVFDQIDRMADYLGEELDHFAKVVLLEGDALTVPAERLAEALVYARDAFGLGPQPFAHAFAKASTVAPMPPEALRRLAQAGLLNVNFGLESGCQELLDLVKRGQTLDEFRQAVDKLLDGGIEVSLNIIGGLGGVTFQERHTEETVAFVQSLPRGAKVFYSGLAVSPASHYARKQSAIFGGEVTPEEMSRQMRVFEQELKAAEYLFVPM
jgi:hypothetical protein